VREGGHLEVPGVDGRIILGWLFRHLNVGAWTELIWLRIGTDGGPCKRIIEPSGSLKCVEFLE
jgi:hypothetical protein